MGDVNKLSPWSMNRKGTPEHAEQNVAKLMGGKSTVEWLTYNGQTQILNQRILIGSELTVSEINIPRVCDGQKETKT